MERKLTSIFNEKPLQDQNPHNTDNCETPTIKEKLPSVKRLPSGFLMELISIFTHLFLMHPFSTP